MARKRTPLDEDRLLALMGQGWTAQAIADDLNSRGGKVSRATVDNRMRERRGHVATSRAKGPPPKKSKADPGSDSKRATRKRAAAVEDVPTEADLEEAEKKGPAAVADTLERIIRLGREAEASRNLPIVGRLLALELQARESLRKHTPPERPDPNETPDMIRIAASTKTRLFQMVDMVLGE